MFQDHPEIGQAKVEAVEDIKRNILSGFLTGMNMVSCENMKWILW